jgi:hypothetical protein
MNRGGPGEATPIGEVFTPLPWGIRAVRDFGLLPKWLGGATVLDPTMGTGNLLEALVAAALEDGHSPEDLPAGNLYGVELRPSHIEDFLRRIGERYGIFPPRANFTAGDLLFLEQTPVCDLLLGNPPWLNFTDLPAEYKERVKQKFIDYGLVKNLRDVLLGGSRIEFAALIAVKALSENLRPRGEAVFFLPLSLILNDGANSRFRTGRTGGRTGDGGFSIEKVYDLSGENVFPGVTTRYGLFHIRKDKTQEFPVPFIEEHAGGRRILQLRPFPGPSDPWITFDGDGTGGTGDGGLPGGFPGGPFEPIEVPGESLPRQGINTSGANDLFFFEDCREYPEYPGTEDVFDAELQADSVCRLSNSVQKDVLLPKKYVHPLITAANFRENDLIPRKWVFIPHGIDGRPLGPEVVEGDPLLADYLGRHRDRLCRRKGVLINGHIKKGRYWALLGVGPYCFFPWKIVWQAYGVREFTPKIFPGTWQGNQSLQCYMPFRDKSVCAEVWKLLGDGRASAFLKAAKMEGTMNWAQPGKIKRLLRSMEAQLPLL